MRTAPVNCFHASKFGRRLQYVDDLYGRCGCAGRRAGLAGRRTRHPKGAIPGGGRSLSTRLKRLSDRLNEGVKNNELPGAVVLIARNGKIVMFESYGFRDKEAKVAMTNDTIFRIASMTKPIVTLAAMMLMEEGKLTLADRVSMYIPAFADTKVAVQKKKEDGTVEVVLEPQFRPMTVHDLMRHTSGLTWRSRGRQSGEESYLDMKVADRSQTTAEMADKLAKLAVTSRARLGNIDADPDVLGRVIEVASGMPLDKFIEERITKPLKMATPRRSQRRQEGARGAKPMKEGPKNELLAIPDVTEKFTRARAAAAWSPRRPTMRASCRCSRTAASLTACAWFRARPPTSTTADALPPNIKMGADMFRFEALEPSANMGQGFGLGFAVRNVQGVTRCRDRPTTISGAAPTGPISEWTCGSGYMSAQRCSLRRRGCVTAS